MNDFTYYMSKYIVQNADYFWLYYGNTRRCKEQVVTRFVETIQSTL